MIVILMVIAYCLIAIFMIVSYLDCDFGLTAGVIGGMEYPENVHESRVLIRFPLSINGILIVSWPAG